MNKIIASLTLGALVFAAPLSVGAAQFLSQEETVTVNAPVDDDLYAAAGVITIQQDVKGDVFAAAERVDSTGHISGDMAAAGNTVRVGGTVDDDIFAAANSVTIDAVSADDIFIAGNTVSIAQETDVRGDVYAAGQEVTLAGTYAGTVRAAGEKITIVSGTRINGDLLTYGSSEPMIQDDVQITGERKHQLEQRETEPTRALLMSWLRRVVTWFVAAVLALYLLPAFTQRVLATAQQRGLRALGLGFLWLVLFIPASIVLAMTVIGLPLMVLVLLLTGLLLLLTSVFANIMVGELVMRRLMKVEAPLTWQHVLLGTVVYKSVQLIPIIGFAVTVALTLWLLGAVVLAFWHHLRPVSIVPV